MTIRTRLTYSCAAWIALALFCGCAAATDEGDVSALTEALERDSSCLALGDPELEERELDRLMAAYPECAEAVDVALRRDEAVGRWTRFELVNDDGPTFYECGTLTCTCYNTMDCLVMAWEKTDGPCVNNGGGGKTCCIEAC